jgi:hypothetical protein
MQPLPGRLPFNPATRGAASGLTIYGALGGPNLHGDDTGQHDRETEADELDADADVRQQKLQAVGHGA